MMVRFSNVNTCLEKWAARARLAAPRRPLVLFALAVFLVACARGPRETGTLEGHVTIGPLEPVAREGQPEPTPAPEVYASRAIMIYDRHGRTEVTKAQIDAKGNYRAVLPDGTYVVDINHVGIDRGIDLPRTVEINAGQVTRLDIEIDTGIR